MSPPMLACSVCAKRDAAAYYKVAHVLLDGTEEPVTVVCSIRCLLSWGYQYASMQGAKMAYGVKAAVKEIADWFRVK